MQRYQPPHRRGPSNLPSTVTSTLAEKPTSTSLPDLPDSSAQVNESRIDNPPHRSPMDRQSVTRNLSKSSGNPLVSTQDLRPSRRDFTVGRGIAGAGSDAGIPGGGMTGGGNRETHGGLRAGSGTGNWPKTSHEMEMLASISRSGGDGLEGDTLKDWTVQERFRSYIDERLAKHYETFNTGPDVSPNQGPAGNEQRESLSSIVLLLRKLREGVVASHRIDRFAIQVFECSARISILARNTPQFISAISGLVPGLYEAYDKAAMDDEGLHKDVTNEPSSVSNGRTDTVSLDQSLSEDETLLRAVAGISLNAEDNRKEFASLLLLYHLSRSMTIYQTILETLTLPPVPLIKLSPPLDVSLIQKSSASPFLPLASISKVVKIQQILSPETFSPIAFFDLLRPQAGILTVYEQCVLSWVSDSVRERAWLVLKKSYLDVGVEWAGRWLGLEVGELQEWVEGNEGRVEAGRVKLR